MHLHLDQVPGGYARCVADNRQSFDEGFEAQTRCTAAGHACGNPEARGTDFYRAFEIGKDFALVKMGEPTPHLLTRTREAIQRALG
ncbi:hypothetical protein [Erythrobacter aureus]|uniref:Uncharacterized protein n=1 Tax=Erythrobacter aureus TaxID=2182384 RepID=A0A345YIP6_9SPHN|nr:hypothetical protein [Erythrobacter aureus]AXK43798.1 hypothetical protein DVR09_15185 [Erythrobacter aureus]